MLEVVVRVFIKALVVLVARSILVLPAPPLLHGLGGLLRCERHESANWPVQQIFVVLDTLLYLSLNLGQLVWFCLQILTAQRQQFNQLPICFTVTDCRNLAFLVLSLFDSRVKLSEVHFYHLPKHLSHILLFVGLLLPFAEGIPPFLRQVKLDRVIFSRARLDVPLLVLLCNDLIFVVDEFHERDCNDCADDDRRERDVLGLTQLLSRQSAADLRVHPC